MKPQLTQLADAIRARTTSASDVLETVLQRIGADDLNAWVHVDVEGARRTAHAIDARIIAGEDPGPLAGVPFGVKDLDDAIGMPTRRGSRWFRDAPAASQDDLHVARLRRAGAVPVGKTATPQFGSAAFTASAIHGATGNPWAPDRTPGGSSGGSSAAVASGMVPFCTASDGGGSIRGPAAFTSLPGLRPSYGRIPSYASTHVAQNAVNFALAPTVEDTALLLDVCAGPDPRDRTCLPAAGFSYRLAMENLDVAGLRWAYSDSYGIGPVDHEVAELARTGAAKLADAAELEHAPLDAVLPFFYDTYAKLEGVDRWIDLPEGLWPQRADELGDLAEGWASGARARLPQLAAVFTQRRQIEQTVAAWFEDIDVLITPTLGVTPFAAEGPLPETIEGQEVHPFIGLLQPIMPSICNLPAISLPVGCTAGGLPVGMQVIAGLHREDRCLRLARIWEQTCDWPTLPGLRQGFLPPQA